MGLGIGYTEGGDVGVGKRMGGFGGFLEDGSAFAQCGFLFRCQMVRQCGELHLAQVDINSGT